MGDEGKTNPTELVLHKKEAALKRQVGSTSSHWNQPWMRQGTGRGEGRFEIGGSLWGMGEQGGG